MEQDCNCQQNQKRRQEHTNCRSQRSQEASLLTSHISSHIYHNRTGRGLAECNKIRKHLCIHPLIFKDYIPDQGNRTICAAEGKQAYFQKSSQQLYIDHRSSLPAFLFPGLPKSARPTKPLQIIKYTVEICIPAIFMANAARKKKITRNI